MISKDGWGLRFPDIYRTDEKKTPGKTSTRKTDPTGDRTQARSYPSTTGGEATKLEISSPPADKFWE